eukprot:TRINITY_DN16854_c0_g1_i1.p1 TRINITY_DN16854_c0_g1~~TRINITY_DN16854_c0_g1_i1.p1  ORF type:complete len:129 (-),score=28.08 TRINITY_DN16854_c0_g1_i1:45-431(-)
MLKREGLLTTNPLFPQFSQKGTLYKQFEGELVEGIEVVGEVVEGENFKGIKVVGCGLEGIMVEGMRVEGVGGSVVVGIWGVGTRVDGDMVVENTQPLVQFHATNTEGIYIFNLTPFQKLSENILITLS